MARFTPFKIAAAAVSTLLIMCTEACLFPHPKVTFQIPGIRQSRVSAKLIDSKMRFTLHEAELRATVLQHEPSPPQDQEKDNWPFAELTLPRKGIKVVINSTK